MKTVRIKAMICASEERRNGVLAETLRSWDESDWPVPPTPFFGGNSVGDNCRINIDRNAKMLLEAFLEDPDKPDYLLYTEDDIEVNHHIWHNLSQWSPLKYGFLSLGTIYNPGLPPYFDNELSLRRDQNYLMTDTCNMWGAQALILNRSVVPLVISYWEANQAYPDIKIPRAIQVVNSCVYAHTPSLVQHRLSRSLVGNPSNFARDYSSTWKAKERS